LIWLTSGTTCFDSLNAFTGSTEFYTLSLHDALPISSEHAHARIQCPFRMGTAIQELLESEESLFIRLCTPVFWSCVQSIPCWGRSEEHTSELQSLAYLVSRLLHEKNNQ